MRIKTALLRLKTGKNHIIRDAEKLRGYFGNIYQDNDLFHNHQSDGKDIYRYPFIQYKVIEGNLSIFGINEGADLVKNEFVKQKELNIDDKIYPVIESSIEMKEQTFGVCDELYEYQLVSPWLALNQKNTQAYFDGEYPLNKAMINNLLGDMKGLGIRAEQKIMVKGHFKQTKIELKNKSFIGFYGTFTANVLIPDFIGTGKRKSIGYGVIKKKKS